jgi:hypothetical protein
LKYCKNSLSKKIGKSVRKPALFCANRHIDSS